MVQYYYDPPDYWKALEFDTEVNLKILERFADAGIEFAFPTSTQRLEAVDSDAHKFELVNEALPVNLRQNVACENARGD